MTYARSRLLVGMSAVGTVVTVSFVALVVQWPATLLPTEPGLLRVDLTALLTLLIVHAALLAPFDLFGGFVLPRRYGRSDQTLSRFLASWVRGVTLQLALVTGMAFLLLVAGRLGGVALTAAAFAVCMLLLLGQQERLARWIGRLRRDAGDLGSPRVGVLLGNDSGFTGGVVGLPGRERMVVPGRWGALLGQDGVEAQLMRWSGVTRDGSRTFGLWVAGGFNLAGFTLATQLPGADVVSVAGLTTVALGFTLWTFIGLLLLPSVSRRGVLRADGHAARDSADSQAVLTRTLRRLDGLQDDEPRREPAVETIFHPIPSLSRRLDCLQARTTVPVSPWHVARTALFLSWAGLGFLSRAVHCNSGRPELWALLPCD